MVKAVIFDVFGTLLRSVDPHGPYFRLSKLVPSSNYLMKRHEMMTTSKPFADYASEATADVSPLLQALDNELAGITAFDDVSAYLDSLRWRGYRVAVCSNLAQAYGARVRELVPDVERHFFSYEIGLMKPDPAIYAHVASELAVAPEECLFVGDSERADVKGPAMAGMQSLKIERHRYAPPIHEQVDPVLRNALVSVVSSERS
ncbi:HAD-IA family hydrolase [Agrobacterium rubi]|nr:HAD-IA family hydrolase [Agrobacterium rubi]NTF24323.1 HAD-IA family hydrolase [Agrobacterium rubi]